MKKWIRMTALALAALLALAGCGKKQEPAGDRLAQIQQKGELVIALEGNWAPWSFHDDSDALVGYDVEVGKAIAEKLGYKNHSGVLKRIRKIGQAYEAYTGVDYGFESGKIVG